MEGNLFVTCMDVHSFLGIKMLKRVVEFSFLRNAIVIFLSLTLAQK